MRVPCGGRRPVLKTIFISGIRLSGCPTNCISKGLVPPQVYYLKTAVGLFQDLHTVTLEVGQVEMSCSMRPLSRRVLILSHTPLIFTQSPSRFTFLTWSSLGISSYEDKAAGRLRQHGWCVSTIRPVGRMEQLISTCPTSKATVLGSWNSPTAVFK